MVVLLYHTRALPIGSLNVIAYTDMITMVIVVCPVCYTTIPYYQL